MSVVQVELANGLGNRMFQYAFARKYCEIYGHELHTTPHIWQKVFDLNDGPPIEGLKQWDNCGWLEWQGRGGLHITGMGQSQTNLIYTREDCRRWFKLKPEYEELVKNVPSLDIVASLRLGDYTYACNPFVLIDPESYLECCDQNGLERSKVYFLNGEEHYRIPGIPVSKPWVQLTDAERLDSIDFLPDLALMMRAKVLIRSNSTFAWWAATLGNNERVFCPDVSKVNAEEGKAGMYRKTQKVPFVEGNHTPVGVHPTLTDLRLPE